MTRMVGLLDCADCILSAAPWGGVCAIFAHRPLSCGLSPRICRIFYCPLCDSILFHFISFFRILSRFGFVFRFSICRGKLFSIMTQSVAGDILMVAWALCVRQIAPSVGDKFYRHNPLSHLSHCTERNVFVSVDAYEVIIIFLFILI